MTAHGECWTIAEHDICRRHCKCNCDVGVCDMIEQRFVDGSPLEGIRKTPFWFKLIPARYTTS